MITRKSKIGLSPGSLVYVGDRKDEPVRISIIHYDADHATEMKSADIEDVLETKPGAGVVWINVSGVHDIRIIEKIGRRFDLHPLLLEDILNTEQRPKIDDYDDYLFLTLKMAYFDTKDKLELEQVGIVISSGVIISFQEREGDVFEAVRERIRKAKGRIRKSGADYLAYALIDMVVDHYFGVLEKIGDIIEDLQEEVIHEPDPETLHYIQNLKHQIIHLRRSVWPLREVVNWLLRGESNLVGRDVMIYLKDIYDHTIQVADTVETYRDMLASLLDIYLSSLSNKMNETMKVLTVIATLFIPLTFFTGIYGMNFKYMPELDWRYSYPIFWLFVIVVFIMMIFMFKRKNWL